MNKDNRNDIIKYRIERSKETYQEAILMNRENHWNACANRLYYSCFYAVITLLQKHDMASEAVLKPPIPGFYRELQSSKSYIIHLYLTKLVLISAENSINLYPQLGFQTASNKK